MADYSDVVNPGDPPKAETFVIKFGKDGRVMLLSYGCWTLTRSLDFANFGTMFEKARKLNMKIRGQADDGPEEPTEERPPSPDPKAKDATKKKVEEG
jgi:hypothetical protein